MKIRWLRIIGAAFLFEVALVALTIPLTMVWPMETLVPFVPAMVFAVGIPFGWWVVRNVKSGFVVHGTLVGIVATLIYFALILAQLGSLWPAVELYGPVLFFLANVLKILGCVVGAYAGASAKRQLLREH